MARPSQQVDLGDTLRTEQATAYEQANVHAVYDVIANHFSSTRYKSLAPGSIGADLGCGNGKYLHLRSALGPAPDASIVTLGSDRCEPLIKDAQHNFLEHGKNHAQEVAVADALCSQLRSAALVATIHHFSTSRRRMHAVQELIRIIKPVKRGQYSNDDLGEGSGRFLIFVWAYEQRGGGRRKFDSNLGDSENAQDVLVPWVMTPQHTNQQDTEETTISSARMNWKS